MRVNWLEWKEQDEISYSDNAVHPRFGQGPRLTGSNPRPSWLSRMLVPFVFESRIHNTAIEADLDRQNYGSVPTPHYFDERRLCRDCKRKFIFFAEEQKHWYEELGFNLSADCVRCTDCRKTQQGIGRLSARYMELMALPTPTTEQSLETVTCCLSLVESGTFHKRQAAHIRKILNRAIPSWKTDPEFTEILERVQKIEAE